MDHDKDRVASATEAFLREYCPLMIPQHLVAFEWAVGSFASSFNGWDVDGRNIEFVRKTWKTSAFDLPPTAKKRLLIRKEVRVVFSDTGSMITGPYSFKVRATGDVWTWKQRINFNKYALWKVTLQEFEEPILVVFTDPHAAQAR
ncbi:hypothetical protein JCM11491_001792 [Sporobolomyces phaffii]